MNKVNEFRSFNSRRSGDLELSLTAKSVQTPRDRALHCDLICCSYSLHSTGRGFWNIFKFVAQLFVSVVPQESQWRAVHNNFKLTLDYASIAR